MSFIRSLKLFVGDEALVPTRQQRWSSLKSQASRSCVEARGKNGSPKRRIKAPKRPVSEATYNIYPAIPLAGQIQEKTMSPLIKIALTFAAAAGLGLPAMASASTFDTADRYTSAVNFGDLNLASEEGQATLGRRISRAANLVCRETAPAANAQCKARIRSESAPAVKVAIARSGGSNLAVRETRTVAIVGN